MSEMTECPHGTYYPVEACNPCGLEDGRIKPLPRGGRVTLSRSKVSGKCPGCGDHVEAGDLAARRFETGSKPWCAGCVEGVPA